MRTQMRKRLRGSRFALAGDSLMRQWFEILTCFLGLSVPTWFAIPPAEVPMVGPHMHVNPHGYSGRTAGYSIAGGSSTVEYFFLDTAGNLSDVAALLPSIRLRRGQLWRVVPQTAMDRPIYDPL